MTPETQRAVERLIADIDAEMNGRQRGYADVRGELLFRCRDALSEASAREGVLEGALVEAENAIGGVIAWDTARAHIVPYRVRDPLHKFLSDRQNYARTALSRTTPIEEA